MDPMIFQEDPQDGLTSLPRLLFQSTEDLLVSYYQCKPPSTNRTRKQHSTILAAERTLGATE